MSAISTQISIRGKAVQVPSARIHDRTVIVSGKWFRTATLQDEELTEDSRIADPVSFIAQLKESGIGADLFTFSQQVPDAVSKHQYHVEWDNWAVIPVTTYAEWWGKRVDASVRRAVRKAAKSGVTVRVADFDDAFVQGIVGINNETPIRQGRHFWHYQKSFEAVKEENSTYFNRNIFLGAYYQEKLIGFIRIICTNKIASIIQLLTMTAHFDKRPANALIAKAVEVCEQMGFTGLVYCNYVYNDPQSSLTEFKRRNGFEQILLPRYYVPVTLKGQMVLKLGLHRGFVQRIPGPLLLKLLRIRNWWYSRKSRNLKEAAQEQ